MSDSPTPADGVAATTDANAGELVARRQGVPGRTRIWIVLVPVVVALGIGVATAFVLMTASGGIQSGAGRATFNWTLLHPNTTSPSTTGPIAAFTGDIEGHRVTGTSTLVIPPGASSAPVRPPTGAIPVFRYRGSFAGSSFDVTVSFDLPPPMNSSDPGLSGTTSISVAGTYGNDPVRATVTSATWSGGTVRRFVHFTGTIGKWKVTGTIAPTTGTAMHQRAVAQFLVST